MADDNFKSFGNVDFGLLASAPGNAVAKSQALLAQTNIETIKSYVENKISFNLLKRDSLGKDAFDNDIVNESIEEYEASVLLVSEPPIISYEKFTTDFTMSLKSTEVTSKKVHVGGEMSGSAKVGWGPFSVGVEFKGSASTDSDHRRTTDNSAVYSFHIEGGQQAPSEGVQWMRQLIQDRLAPKNIKSDETTKALVDNTDEKSAKDKITAALMVADKADAIQGIARLRLEKLKGQLQSDPSKQKDVDSQTAVFEEKKQLALEAQEDLIIKQQALSLYRKYKGHIKYDELVTELSGDGSSTTPKPKEDPKTPSKPASRPAS